MLYPLLLSQLLCPLLLGQLLCALLFGQPLDTLLFGDARRLLLLALLGVPLRDLLRKPALRFLTRQRGITLALLLGQPLLGQVALTRLFTLLLSYQFILDHSGLPDQRFAAALGLGPRRRLGSLEYGLLVGPASRLACAFTLGRQARAFFFAPVRIGLGRHLGRRFHCRIGRPLTRHGVGVGFGLGIRGRQLEIVVRRRILSDYPCRQGNGGRLRPHAAARRTARRYGRGRRWRGRQWRRERGRHPIHEPEATAGRMRGCLGSRYC